MSKKTKYYVYRDAETGHFVTEEYAKENPKTTVKESVKIETKQKRITMALFIKKISKSMFWSDRPGNRAIVCTGIEGLV